MRLEVISISLNDIIKGVIISLLVTLILFIAGWGLGIFRRMVDTVTRDAIANAVKEYINSNPDKIIVKPDPDAKIPIGTILPFFGEKIPDGFYLCDGREITDDLNCKPLLELMRQQPASYDSTCLQAGKVFLPNLGGLFLRGRQFSNGASLDPDGVRALGNVQKDMISSHGHTAKILKGHSEKIGDGIEGTADFGGEQANINTDSLVFTPGVNTQIGVETRPANAAVNFIIRVR